MIAEYHLNYIDCISCVSGKMMMESLNDIEPSIQKEESLFVWVCPGRLIVSKELIQSERGDAEM